jgi:secreted trypsin-like serine protease
MKYSGGATLLFFLLIGLPAIILPIVLPKTLVHTAEAPLLKRIVGGQEVDLNLEPRINYQVGVRAGNGRCGGVIINSEWILSAAHCFFNRISFMPLVQPNQVTVRTGIRFDNTPRAIQSIVMPDSYTAPESPDSVAQDIALLRLSQPLTFSASVAPAALPNASCGDCEGNGTQYIVSGYGLDECPAIGECSYSNAQPVNNLRYVNLRYVSREACVAANPLITLAIDVICAEGIDPDLQDSCQGDSGGPLVVDQGAQASPRYKVAGVVSGGTASTDPLCAVPGQYGIYTGIAVNRAWIDGVINATELPSSMTGAACKTTTAFAVGFVFLALVATTL